MMVGVADNKILPKKHIQKYWSSQCFSLIPGMTIKSVIILFYLYLL